MFTNFKAVVVTALLVWSRVHCSPIPEANNDEFNKLLKEASEGTLTVRPNLGKPEPLGTTKTLLDQFFHDPKSVVTPEPASQSDPVLISPKMKLPSPKTSTSYSANTVFGIFLFCLFAGLALLACGCCCRK